MKQLFRIITTLVITAGTANLVPAAPSPADVDELLGSYYRIHQGLVGDALDAAANAAAAIGKHAAAPAELTVAADAVATAPDIAVARDKFQALTDHMRSLVESVGTHDGTVYVARCPMAFGGRGGTWLQGDKTIANPYFGSKMLRCGGIIEEVGGSASAREAASHGSQ